MKKKLLMLISIGFISLSFVGCNETTDNNVINVPSTLNNINNQDNSTKENINESNNEPLSEEDVNETNTSNQENTQNEVVSEVSTPSDTGKDTVNENITETTNENTSDKQEENTNLVTISPDIILEKIDDLESLEETIIEMPDEDSVKVIEHGNIVEITLKPSTIYTINEAAIKEDAKKNGFISYKMNEDGSVTYIMTKETRDNTLIKYKKEIDDAINEILNGEEKNTSFTNIEYNDNFSEFTIYCDSSKYTAFDSMYSLSFKISGYYYQSFLGIKSDSIKVKVNFVDKDTHKVIHTDVYPK